MNPLKHLGANSKPPCVGDIFSLSVEDERFVFGRVVKERVFYRAALLIYIYGGVSDELVVPPTLSKERLLIPPLLTNAVGFEEGFFRIVESRPIEDGEVFERHCFKVGSKYVDESNAPVETPFEPMTRKAVSGHGAVGIRVAQALGLLAGE